MNNPEDLLTVVRDVNSPPGGWKYTVPETGITITAPFWAVLKPRIIQHLTANRISVDDERMLQIENDACAETQPPGSWCQKRPPKPVAGMPIPLLGAVETFLKCIWAAIVRREFVSREEAQRRLDICMECPLRGASPGGCTGCYTLLKKANSLLEDKGAFVIEADADGFVRDTCQACLCVLPLKVWLGDKTLNRCEGGKRPPYARGCWRLEG